MHYRKMTKNYIFRKFVCGLTKEQTAKLCFKSVRTITGWDKGKPIPPECKRLMRITKGRELSSCSSWKGYKMHFDKMELPTGQLVSPQQIVTALALLEIGDAKALEVNAKLLKLVRAVSYIKYGTQD
ncbi:regulator [Vibrio fluvialis]|nr:regulator [Vibrio fluvialis]MBY8260158.1 regulator [Vibrio fluvialis]MBY8303987.1 regulator [Vibrio fluvialis]